MITEPTIRAHLNSAAGAIAAAKYLVADHHIESALALLDKLPVYDGIVFYAPDAEPSSPTRSRLVPDSASDS